jgi:pantetheine-phosphate adenylyltransferase
MSKASIIVYPGTFDPMTLGHLDLVQRGAALFDRVVIAVAAWSKKATGMFSLEERVEMAREACEGLDNVAVKPMYSMLVDFVRGEGARTVLRGLRAYSDFEYEFQMAQTNRKLAPEVETLFLMPKEEHSYVSSSIVREVARFAGDTSGFVPPAVQRHIERRVVLERLRDPSALP